MTLFSENKSVQGRRNEKALGHGDYHRKSWTTWVRGKELEENGYGVVLDKKRARPLRPRPD